MENKLRELQTRIYIHRKIDADLIMQLSLSPCFKGCVNENINHTYVRVRTRANVETGLFWTAEWKLINGVGYK